MVFKSDWRGGGVSYEPPREIYRPPVVREEGRLVALVGRIEGGEVSRSRRLERVERLYKIDGNLLGYNLDGRRVLMRCERNDRAFDMYIEMSFMKGVTERETGRTLMIAGSTAHHIEAMDGQFNGVMWEPENNVQVFGNAVRWINVGDMKSGFIGLDYRVEAAVTEGVARELRDVKFLAQTLCELGYDGKKQLFLLNPPYIVEREEGRKLRAAGFVTLLDYVKKELPKIS